MDAHFQIILPEIEKTITESQSYEPLLAALRMMRRLFRSKPFGVEANFMKENDRILKILKSSLQHDYSKVVSEALRVTGSFLNALRTKETSTISSSQASLAQSLYDLITVKLDKVDIDQDVKSCSIIAAANLVAVCHTVLQPMKISHIITIFSDRLQQELTRDATLKGLTMIALNESSLKS
jgi:cullin-associated NEDD8-dissociated protein 1